MPMTNNLNKLVGNRMTTTKSSMPQKVIISNISLIAYNLPRNLYEIVQVKRKSDIKYF